MEDFAIIPYHLFDAQRDGEITQSMFQAMLFLHKWANWNTGVVRKVRATRMEEENGEGGYKARTFQKALQHLEEAGYIKSGHKQGSKKSYPVTINNYRALMGALKDQVLNPCEITDWRNLSGDEGGDTGGEEGCEEGGDVGGEEGCDGATILEFEQEFDKSSSKTSDKTLERTLSLPTSDSVGRLPAETFSFDDIQKSETDLRTSTARDLLCSILHTVFHEDYSAHHEAALLPRVLELFPVDVEDERIWRDIYFNGSAFSDYVAARKKIMEKMLSVNDWLFHYENKSGHESGWRHQFEAYKRSLAKKSAQSADNKIKKNLKFTKQAPAPIRKEEWPEPAPKTPQVPSAPPSNICSWCKKNPPSQGFLNCQECRDGYDQQLAQSREMFTKKELAQRGATR